MSKLSKCSTLTYLKNVFQTTSHWIRKYLFFPNFHYWKASVVIISTPSCDLIIEKKCFESDKYKDRMICATCDSEYIIAQSPDDLVDTHPAYAGGYTCNGCKGASPTWPCYHCKNCMDDYCGDCERPKPVTSYNLSILHVWGFQILENFSFRVTIKIYRFLKL